MESFLNYSRLKQLNGEMRLGIFKSICKISTLYSTLKKILSKVSHNEMPFKYIHNIQILPNVGWLFSVFVWITYLHEHIIFLNFLKYSVVFQPVFER